MQNYKRTSFFKMFFSGFFRTCDLFAIYKDDKLEETVKNATANRLSWYRLSKPHTYHLNKDTNEKHYYEEELENYILNNKENYKSCIASYWNATGNYIYNAMNTFDEKNGSKL